VATTLAECQRAVRRLTFDNRARVIRGLAVWNLENVSQPVPDERAFIEHHFTKDGEPLLTKDGQPL
jgi:hypothetical protein